MKYFSILFALTASITAFGQQELKPIMCGNDIFSNIVRENHPVLYEAFNTTFDEARHATTRRSEDPLTINVVVHVVWKEEAENLHDSIILNQIQILNQDFNRENADTANLRAIFREVAGNADIRFELSEILRVQTNQEFDVDILGTNFLPEVKHSQEGGSNAWDTEHYLNIWVCKIQPIEIFGIEVGQILGFAFPPNGLANWPPDVSAPTPEEDGVVIDFRVFGGNNPNTVEIPGEGGILPVRGRTPVHEVGHYLGLRHIWGDGGILGPNDCNQSDGVDDTPYADAQSLFDCDTLKNSCEHIETFYNFDAPDLIENFMDYASEECMNMFTHGQIEIMRNVIIGPRNGLISPPASVDRMNDPLELRLSPNPAGKNVRLDFETANTTPLEICIINSHGVTLMSQPWISDEGGTQQLILDTNTLPGGVYIVKVSTLNGFQARTLVVNHGD
jgi:hypothetical protein